MKGDLEAMYSTACMVGSEWESNLGDTVDIAKVAGLIVNDSDFNKLAMEFMYNHAGILDKPLLDKLPH